MKTNKNVKVLVVEDERIVAKDIQNTLKNLGYEVAAISSTGENAIEKSGELKPDIVLMDIVLKGSIDGIEAAKQIRNKFKIPIIYLTAYEDSDTLDRAKLTEPLGYILKPFEERDLHSTLEMALYKHSIELKLLESEEKYRRLVELSPDGIIVQYDDKITFANKSAAKILSEKSVNNVLNCSLLKYIPQSNHELFKEKVKYINETSTLLPFSEEQFLKRDGTSFDVEVAIIPFTFEDKNALQIIFRDITERKKSQKDLKKAYEEIKNTHQALINAEKHAALGRFSAGIAHEIRNPLANISASAQYCVKKFELDDNMKKHFELILRNTDTANRIIKELLDYTSPRETIMKNGNIEGVIDKVCRLVKSRCAGENIKIIKEIENNLPSFPINEKKIEEAFLNFFSNAIESMSSQPVHSGIDNTLKAGSGTLTISALKVNDNIVVKISDTGVGIPESDLDKVLEPFFTTKNEGIGLGLSLAFNAIQAHSANLKIESTVGSGTTFCIEFPIKKNFQEGREKNNI